MDDYITKPFEIEDLEAILERWLPKKGSALNQPKKLKEPLDEPVTPTLLASQSPGINTSDLTKNRNPEKVQHIINSYVSTTSVILEQIHAAVEKENISEIASLVHKLKGPSLLISATAIADVCIQMEGSIQNSDWSKIKLLLQELENLFNQFKESHPSQ